MRVKMGIVKKEIPCNESLPSNCHITDFEIDFEAIILIYYEKFYYVQRLFVLFGFIIIFGNCPNTIELSGISVSFIYVFAPIITLSPI